MPVEQIAMSEQERRAVERIAADRGVSFDEAAEQMCKEGLALRVRRVTGRPPAKVYEFGRRKS